MLHYGQRVSRIGFDAIFSRWLARRLVTHAAQAEAESQ
jgi:hypothetical protein